MPHFQDANGGLHYLSDQDVANGGLTLIPSGSVEISEADVDAIRATPLTDEQLSAQLRAQRDAALADTDWLVQRHQDETMFAESTTLTKEQIAALGKYRKALRDLPSAKGFPHVALPAAPDFTGGR